MKFRRFLAGILATFMAVSALSVVSFADAGKAQLLSTTLEPKTLPWNFNGSAQGSTLTQNVVDEYGRYYNRHNPMSTSGNVISPGGSFETGTTTGYTVLKLVYKTSDSYIPHLALDFKWESEDLISYDVTPQANKWNTVYYTLSKEMAIYQFFMSSKAASACTANDYYYVGYAALFGDMEDAKVHKSAFEGDLTITSVKVGGTEIATTGGTYTYNVNGATKVPALTISATGNTNDVVITEGEFDESGNATSTVKNGNQTLVTVNFTGGMHKDVVPAVMNFELISAKSEGVTSVSNITDDFSRTYKRFIPAQTYYENGSDLESTVPVSPGGNVSTILPSGMEVSDYEAVKVVLRSNEDYAPKLRCTGTTSGDISAANESDFVKNKWCVLYYPISGLTKYQLVFTPDVSKNHPSGEYYVAYAAMFENMEKAMANKTAFEGEFTITDVKLGGSSIGNVTTYTKDLAGSGVIPKLTVTATGDAEGVTITNGTINAQGEATSKVMKNGTALVTVNFTGADTTFKVINLLVDGKPIDGFNSSTSTYTVNLGFGSAQPVVTYEFQGVEKTLTVSTASTTENNIVTKYITTVNDGATVLYTITFNVEQQKPEILLNTLYKLNTEKTLNVAYLGGSVTYGTGATDAESKSWRAITGNWLKTAFPDATINLHNAAIGGTGSHYGVYRNKKQVLDVMTPDLMFIETVINDCYDSTYYNNEYIRYTESIIKQTLAKNPKCDFILVVTGDHSRMASDAASNTPVIGTGYDALGERYNIPVMHVSFELAHDIKDEAGSFPASSSTYWQKYFGNDIVHPNDTGYAHYAQTITDYMAENLPASYVPTTSDYKVKTNPTSAYCEEKGYGSVMLDADMIPPTAFYGNQYLGGFSAPAQLIGTHYARFSSWNAGDCVSFTFNSSNLALWSWTEAGSTTLKYSIDGGEIKTLTLSRGSANHMIYKLAEGLDNSKTHTVRLYHNDAEKPVHICWFLMSGMPEGQAASLQVVPYFNFNTETYSVTIDGVEFEDFDPAVKNYQIPLADASSGNLPKIAFNTESVFHAYEIEQATDQNSVAKLKIDNVGTYSFEFVYGEAVEIKTVKNSKRSENTGSVEFTEAAKYSVQVKSADATWSTATSYPAGTTKIDGLGIGKYNVRYVLGSDEYGFARAFTIWTDFESDNVYYIKTDGTGDGSSPEKPANAGTSLARATVNAVSYFGDKAKTEKCYIVFVGDVVNNSGDFILTDSYMDLVYTAEKDALFHLQSSTFNFKQVLENSGKTTFEYINVKLGNPNDTNDSNMRSGEISVCTRGNEVYFKEFNTTAFAQNANNVTRTSGLSFNYYADGYSGGNASTGRPVTLDCSGLRFAYVRLTGYSAGNETGGATFVAKNGTFPQFILGNTGQSETLTGVVKGYVEGGSVTNAHISTLNGAGINVGTVALIVNSGTVGTVQAAANSNSDESIVDRVAIFNNGISCSTFTKDNIDYVLKGSAGGTADITTSNNRLTGFTFTTDKEVVVINKGLASEKSIIVKNGKATIATSELPSGEYTVTYEDAPLPTISDLLDMNLDGLFDNEDLLNLFDFVMSKVNSGNGAITGDVPQDTNDDNVINFKDIWNFMRIVREFYEASLQES